MNRDHDSQYLRIDSALLATWLNILSLLCQHHHDRDDERLSEGGGRQHRPQRHSRVRTHHLLLGPVEIKSGFTMINKRHSMIPY